MPTILGHAIFGLSLTPLRPFRGEILKTMLLAMMCAMIPDIDVIGFSFGIKYGSMWGHRGFTHSILFAILFAWLIAWVFYRDHKKDKAIFIFIIYMFFMCTMSHGVFDAMTDGGKGVGFFIPFSNERIFFNYRPIPVSPFGFDVLLTEAGWYILKAELIFIGGISIFIGLASWLWRSRSIDHLE